MDKNTFAEQLHQNDKEKFESDYGFDYIELCHQKRKLADELSALPDEVKQVPLREYNLGMAVTDSAFGFDGTVGEYIELLNKRVREIESLLPELDKKRTEDLFWAHTNKAVKYEMMSDNKNHPIDVQHAMGWEGGGADFSEALALAAEMHRNSAATYI